MESVTLLEGGGGRVQGTGIGGLLHSGGGGGGGLGGGGQGLEEAFGAGAAARAQVVLEAESFGLGFRVESLEFRVLFVCVCRS